MGEKKKNWLRKQNRVLVDGAKLSEARVKAGMAMEGIAAALECNKSQVSRWEQGVLVPSEERIWKLVELLGSSGFIIGNPEYRGGKKA